MNSFTTIFFVLTLLLVLLPSETYAFGAGDIPDFAFLNGKAFRHGDIESILAELAKATGHVSGGGGLLDFAQSVLSAATSGSKFSKEDVKRVYFGNWLRDYSQAMDIAGLSKLSADTLVLIVSVLGFLTFGFATQEFQITPERLGVYLPVEHIDNPKGYAEKEGDARQFHPSLRPPVDPEELEIDESTGMKNYMATENRGWDTSTALIRRVFHACIEHGRRARGREGDDLWEAYRLMGTGLHTLEDLLAHSNWCELALRKLGYNNVFCHVGDNVLINTPNGEAHPLVTGTFGSADFLHSLMGEATDHLSQASVVDLSKKMDEASQGDNNSLGALQSLLKRLPIGGSDDDKMSEANDMQAAAKTYHFDPDNVAPPGVREQLWKLLNWRDNVYRNIIKKIEMVPGLSDLMENLTNALNAFVYTVLAPYVTPILKQVTRVLTEGSKAVIDTDDQYQVFEDPNASDPSHSLLSKDHFALILNEPAGKIAQVVVQNSVKLLVQAWFDNSNPDEVIDRILEAFHHPWFASGRSRIQEEMFQTLHNWVFELENADETIQALSKESVRAGKNKREGSDDDITRSDQIYGGHVSQASESGRSGAAASTYGVSQGYAGPQGYSRPETGDDSQGYGGYDQSDSRRYGEPESRRYDEPESRRYGDSGGDYSRSGNYGGGYGGSEEPQRKYQRGQSGYGGFESRRPEEPSYGRGRGHEESYAQRQDQAYGEESYGGRYREWEQDREQETYGSSYGDRGDNGGYQGERHEERCGYRPDRDLDDNYGSSGGGEWGYRNRREERSGYQEEGPRYREEGFSQGYTPAYDGGGYRSEGRKYGDEGRYGRGEGEGEGEGEGGYGESFGVEKLSLGEEGRHHGHHQDHHRDDEDFD